VAFSDRGDRVYDSLYRKYKDKVHIHSGKRSSCEKNIDKKENHIGIHRQQEFVLACAV
jgi:hypothetical protein